METIEEDDPEIREKIFHISSSGTYIDDNNIYHVKLIVRDYDTRITIKEELSKNDNWLIFVLASTLKTIDYSESLQDNQMVSNPGTRVFYWDLHLHYPEKGATIHNNSAERIMISWEPSKAQRDKLWVFYNNFTSNTHEKKQVVIHFAATRFSKSVSPEIPREFKIENGKLVIVKSCPNCNKNILVGSSLGAEC